MPIGNPLGYLAPDLQNNVQPAARNVPPLGATPATAYVPSQQPQVQANTPAPQQTPPQEDGGRFEQLKQRWRQYLDDPAVKAGLMQFGVAMLTPGVGFGPAVGHGMAAAGRFDQTQRQQQQAQREAQLEERRLQNSERRTDIYGRSVDQQGQTAAGDMTERERFETEQNLRDRRDFEKHIQTRAQNEHERLVETHQSQLENAMLLGQDVSQIGEPPDYNTVYNRVATEEVLRKNGMLPAVSQLPPEDQQAFWKVAETRGPQIAVQVLQQVINTQEQTPEQTDGQQNL